MNEKMDEIIRSARARSTSDIHITEGMPIWFRIHGRLAAAYSNNRPELDQYFQR